MRTLPLLTRSPVRTLAMVLVLAMVGCGTRPCKHGTVLLSLRFSNGAEQADFVDVGVSIDGSSPVTQSAAHTMSATAGTLELDFSTYPANKAITIEVTARAGNQVLAQSTQPVTAGAACTSLSIALDAKRFDGGAADLAPLDAAFDASILDSSSAVDGAPDLADFTISVPSPLRLVQTMTASATVSIARIGGLTEDIVISVSGLPTGVSADPLTIASGTSTGQLTFHSTAAAALGVTTSLTITAAASAINHNAPLKLVVQGASGTLDTTFNVSGKAVNALCVNSDSTGQAVVAANGDIVIAGNCNNAGSSTDVMALTSAGALDSGFATGGKYLHAFTTGGTPADVFTALVAQSDGKVVSSGFAGVAGSSHFFLLARLTGAGGLDTAGFNSANGYAIPDFDSTSLNKDAKSVGLALRPDGNLVAIGFFNDANPTAINSAAFALFTAGGALSKSTFNAPTAGYNAVAARADNFSVVVGSSATKLALARYDVAGDFDGTFGSAGLKVVPLGSNTSAIATSVVVLANNQMMVAGVVQPTSAAVYNAFVARFTVAGDLDTTFGSPNGYVTIASNGSGSVPTFVAVQPDGKVLLASTWASGGATGRDFVVARFNSDGTPDASFTTAHIDFNSGDDLLTGFAVQPDGRIVLAGTVYATTRNDFGVARLWP